MTWKNIVKMMRLWGPVVVWAVLIFYLSDIPGLRTPRDLNVALKKMAQGNEWFTFFDFDLLLRKLAHGVEYFILTFLSYRAFKGTFNLNSFYLILYSAILSISYAVFDEFHQLFVSRRKSSIHDVLIDVIGVLCFLIFLRICSKIKE